MTNEPAIDGWGVLEDMIEQALAAGPAYLAGGTTC